MGIASHQWKSDMLGRHRYIDKALSPLSSLKYRLVHANCLQLFLTSVNALVAQAFCRYLQFGEQL
ncbi:MAG: hypothetical protein WCY98_07370 [Castellaniella sp.]